MATGEAGKPIPPDRVDFETREEVPLDRLFTDAFMAKHTPWKTFDEMLHAAETAFVAAHPDARGRNLAPSEVLTDAFVARHTRFATFHAFARAAGIDFIQGEMAKGEDRFHGMI